MKTLLLLLMLGCDIPSQEEIRAEVDRAADVVDQRIAVLITACAEASAAFSDCSEGRGELAESMATIVLWRLGCVFVDERWDCTNSAFCGVDPNG